MSVAFYQGPTETCQSVDVIYQQFLLENTQDMWHCSIQTSLLL
jgi:hypothetical protein